MFLKDVFAKKAKASEEAAATPVVLGKDQFLSMNLWHWAELGFDDIDSLRYGSLEIVDASPISACESDRLVGADDFATLKRYSLAVGVCRKVMFQYKVFDYNCSALLNGFDFGQNGKISFEGTNLTDAHTQVNALAQNAIISGKKFMDWMERDLDERFGMGSQEFKNWKKATEKASANSFACDFCFRAKNVIEEEFLLVNMVDIDFANRTTGFTIGIDHGFMDHDLGAPLRERMLALAASRMKRGLNPQLPINEVVERFHKQVSLLYAYYLSAMMADADKASDRVLELYGGETNCVVRTVNVTSDGEYPASKLVYRIPNPSMVEFYQSVSDKIESRFAGDAEGSRA